MIETKNKNLIEIQVAFNTLIRAKEEFENKGDKVMAVRESLEVVTG